VSRPTVGLNLLWLVPGQVGGTEQATVVTLRGLRELAPAGLDLRLYALAPFADAYPDVVGAFPSELLHASGRSRPWRVAAEASWLAVRARHIDLVHHLGGTAPLLRTAPFVLTLHDLQPLERTITHGRGKRAYLRAVVPQSVRRARMVAVPSDFVRRSVIARFGLDPTRVAIIPHAVEWPPTRITPPEALRRRYRLDGPVVLYPAITYPHKNHSTLVDAFALVHERHPDALLVLPGGEGASEADLVARIDRFGLGGSVRRLGRIPEADKAGLYEVATVVAMPSEYEGFGLPAMEAMAAGVALVAAQATALPEVVGDAGILVEPHDAPAWATAIARLLDDPTERARLAERGRARARLHTGLIHAGAVEAMYRAALGKAEARPA
jgi:alpha-1,3-rhamnosyl/mannosyltransferase